MILIRIKRKGGQITAVTVSGHAGMAPKGEDIVCAAVSALVQTFYFSLQRLLHLHVTPDIRDGYFFLSLPTDLPAEIAAKITLLAENMLIGLDEINKSYPGFLQVSEE
ncbi:MAG: ribosomal-processing cysteine protease Prp [Firmicutes bacterium]|nr:ribosomal-processing cysteine protease Prp [Bacillota bacterium]